MSDRATLQLIEEPPNTRRTIYRMAMLYTPSAIASAAFGLFALVNLLQGAVGAIVGVVLLGATTTGLGFQAIVALRDLRAQPVTTRGVLRRAWDKGTVLWLSRSYYLRIDAPHPTRPGKQAQHVFVVSPVVSEAIERSHGERYAMLRAMRRSDLEREASRIGVDVDTEWGKSTLVNAIFDSEARVEIEHWPHTNTVIRISLVEYEQERSSSRPTR